MIKERVVMKNITFKIDDVMKLVEENVNFLTVEELISCCKHVIKIGNDNQDKQIVTC
jgi:hypothetical protein